MRPFPVTTVISSIKWVIKTVVTGALALNQHVDLIDPDRFILTFTLKLQ